MPRARLLLTLLPLFILSSARAESGRQTFNLEELLELAERNYPGLEARLHEVEAAEARLDEARISPYMQIRATGNFAVVPEASGTPLYSNETQLNLHGRWGPTVGASVEAAIPIVTFGKLPALRELGRVGVRSSKIEYERTLAKVKEDIVRAYLALQLALDLRVMLDEGLGYLAQARSVLESREASLEAGAQAGAQAGTQAGGDPMDIYRIDAVASELAARAAEISLLEEGARAALETLAGVERFEIEDCPISPFELPPGEERSLAPQAGIEEAIERRPERRLLAEARIARESELRLHRGKFYPDLLLVARAGAQLTPGRTDISNPYISDAPNIRVLGAALALRWELDFYGTYKRMMRGRALLQALDAQTREAEGGMRLELREARARLEAAREKVRAFGMGERSTRGWTVAALQGYQIGTTEARTLIEALKAYYTQRGSRLQAIYELNSAITHYLRVSASGEPPRGGWNSSCLMDEGFE